MLLDEMAANQKYRDYQRNAEQAHLIKLVKSQRPKLQERLIQSLGNTLITVGKWFKLEKPGQIDFNRV